MANLQRRLTALQGRLPSPEEQPPYRIEAGRERCAAMLGIKDLSG